ncbi:MAG TPA: class I SAM-dependent methyltransferase [Pirellulales bacterium]|jgi:SAM-dependent methyltransferase|nr:class I SAM-dependent methyltransferase [Pirellulales bacterium]
MKKNDILCTSWFDYPQWFEIGFENETKKEADFFEKAFDRWCKFPVRKLLEPACGSGRIVVEMARRGYDVTGFDLSQPSLDLLRQKLKRRKLKAHVLKADMTNFRFPKRFDAACCTFNSFRILTTETAARSHLQSVGAALRPGGLFFLGLHLAPPDAEPLGMERWVGQRGRTHVTSTLRVIASDEKRRVERLRINLLVRQYGRNGNGQDHPHTNGKSNGGKKNRTINGTPATITRLRDEFDYRLYTAAQIRRLFKSVRQLELVEVFDFWYDMSEPQKLDNELCDALFVLRRR